MTPTVQLNVLHAGDIPAPAAFAFGLANVFSRGYTMPVLSFLLLHPEHGPLLVDTGLHPDAQRSARADFGRLNGTFLGTLRAGAEPFDAQLRKAGVPPEEIRTVVMTHLHVDHTSGMRLLPNAEFVTDQREWEAAHQPRSVTKGYIAHHLPGRHRMRLIEIGDGQEHDLFGDGSVRLISTPGHTFGHLAVLVESQRGPVLLAGDTVYTMRNLAEDILPLLSADRFAQRASMALLRRHLAEHPDTILVPSHDPSAWRELQAETPA